jgi:hypothetical protein
MDRHSFESVAEAPRRAEKRLPTSVLKGLIADEETGNTSRTTWRPTASLSSLRASPGKPIHLLDRHALVRPAVSGIASLDVVGYPPADEVAALEREYLLVSAARDDGANVLIQVLPEGQYAYPDSLLRLAADLADQRGPREELRAAALLGEVAASWNACP